MVVEACALDAVRRAARARATASAAVAAARAVQPARRPSRPERAAGELPPRQRRGPGARDEDARVARRRVGGVDEAMDTGAMSPRIRPGALGRHRLGGRRRVLRRAERRRRHP